MKQLIVSVLVAVCCVVVFSSEGYALSLNYYGIEDTINEDLTVTNQITLKFGSPINHLNYNLGFKVYDLEYEADFEFVDCKVTDRDGKSEISCDFIGMTEEKNTLILKFKAKNLIKRVGDNYRFTVNYGISLPIKRVFVLIRLPKNGILAGNVANESYFPSTGNTLTDGKHIMVYWEEEELASGDSLQFSVLYSIPIIAGPLYNLFIAALTFIVVIVMIAIAVYIKGGAPEGKKDIVKKAVTSVLNNDEKTIINILNRHDGKANQKHLVRESDFSKAKVSRIVKNLKERGIVDIEPISGRENRIILKIDKLERTEFEEEKDDISTSDANST